MLQEKRINVTTEAFESIRTLKLFGWEFHFIDKIKKFRADQIV